MTDKNLQNETGAGVSNAPAETEAVELPNDGAGLLKAAMDKFDAALATLEDAAVEAKSRGAALGDMEQEIAELRADKERLGKEVSTLRDEARQLEEINDMVSGRLDTAIQGIRSVLEA